jgi:hypothetical protein
VQPVRASSSHRLLVLLKRTGTRIDQLIKEYVESLEAEQVETEY